MMAAMNKQMGLDDKALLAELGNLGGGDDGDDEINKLYKDLENEFADGDLDEEALLGELNQMTRSESTVVRGLKEKADNLKREM